MEAAASSREFTPFEQLRFARQIILHESRTLEAVAQRLDGSFCRAIEAIYHCRGHVIVTGMGKAGLIGRKIAATLSSTGSPSIFLHPAEAIHGDLGRIRSEDVLLALSQSGETEEMVRLLPSFAEFGVPLIAVTSSAGSALGRAATTVIELGRLEEACALGLAPSSSAAAMLAVGDALALVVSKMKNFGREDFARFHPGGSLGAKLSKVEDCMRPLSQCRTAKDSLTVRETLVAVSRPGRRTGATMLIDAAGKLSGIFTDSDLARLFERRRDEDLDRPIHDVMTANPLRAVVGSMMADAIALIAQRKISELPVVDLDGKPVGLIDVTDLVASLPPEVLLPPEAPCEEIAAERESRQSSPNSPFSGLRLVCEPDADHGA